MAAWLLDESPLNGLFNEMIRLDLGMVCIVSYNLKPFLPVKEHYESVSSGYL
ncbi:hypothetical protein QSU96_07630 [Vibrio furnissii]|uniref:hypothetical protein n=1 Tax=Vibrio furnissii TaxID=29494 RepID=UPI0025727546|nr:hypothetical protein [Vibrio furnissii]WJG27573.1 hypothetical protein QSU96_07630 [Vibrio furnissii]